MAHHLDDLARLDLFARGLGLQDRTGRGPDGKLRWYRVLCTPEEADAYAHRPRPVVQS